MIDISDTLRTSNRIERVVSLPKMADIDSFELAIQKISGLQNSAEDDDLSITQNLNSVFVELKNLLSKNECEYGVCIEITESSELGNNAIEIKSSNFDKSERMESTDLEIIETEDNTSNQNWFSLGGTVNSIDPSTGELTTIMTLHEFASLLEQGWISNLPGGEKMWRFLLEDASSPLAQIILRNDKSACGSWSVILKTNIQGSLSNKIDADLLVNLQLLRTRLEKNLYSISNVTMNDDYAR